MAKLRVLFYANEDNGVTKQRGAQIIKAFDKGCRRIGDTVVYDRPWNFESPPTDFDVVCAIGLQPHTRKIAWACRDAGVRVVLFDKGLIRTRNQSRHNRVCIDGGTPNAYLMRTKRHRDRWEAVARAHHIELKPRQETVDGPVVFANNSQKVHDFWDLGPAQALTEATFAQIRKALPDAPLIYRPKRTLKDIVEMDGITLSLWPDKIEDALQNARALVTHGSNCAINAIIDGIPAICLGPCAANVVSGSRVKHLRAPPFPSDDDRYQWLCNLAYAQWTDHEFASGEMWDFIKTELEATKGRTAGRLI